MGEAELHGDTSTPTSSSDEENTSQKPMGQPVGLATTEFPERISSMSSDVEAENLQRVVSSFRNEKPGPRKNFFRKYLPSFQIGAVFTFVGMFMGFTSLGTDRDTDITWQEPRSLERPSETDVLPDVPPSEVPVSAEELVGEVHNRSINRSVEPCDDFFRFVCDGHIQSFVNASGDSASHKVPNMYRMELALRSLFLRTSKAGVRRDQNRGDSRVGVRAVQAVRKLRQLGNAGTL